MTEVTRIIVEDGRAVGVEFNSHHLGRRTVRAPVVISDADLKHTMLDMVGPAYLSEKTLKRTRSYEMSPALGVVFLGVSRDLRAERIPNTNFWVHPSYDQEPVYGEARAGRFHRRPFCFISISSLKDPDNPKDAPSGITNMELVTVAPSQPEAWGTTREEIADGSYRDNPAYNRAKAAFAERLLTAAERVFPRLGGQVVYQEIASPMTHTRFTGSTGGTSYGIALIPSQFLFKRPGNTTDVKGLYLCGASTLSAHGILGTMWSGLLAASRVVGGDVLREVTMNKE
jgi:phytoene dehydrogenase-like protein